MEKSSSQPPNFHPDRNHAPRGRNGDSVSGDAKDPSNRRMVADQLMAALASGNLEHLADARQAFLNQGDSGYEQSPADLEAQLERRSGARAFEQALIAKDELRAEDDELRAEEEALRKAELELELRRAEVRAAKQRAEAEAQRKAAETARRREEEERHGHQRHH